MSANARQMREICELKALVPLGSFDVGIRVLNLWTEYAKVEPASDSITCLMTAGLVVRTSVNKSSSLSRTNSVCSPLSRTPSAERVGSVRAGLRQATTAKTVWVWTKSKDVMIASVEGGWSTFVFTPETKDLANEWTCTFSSLFDVSSKASCST